MLAYITTPATLPHLPPLLRSAGTKCKVMDDVLRLHAILTDPSSSCADVHRAKRRMLRILSEQNGPSRGTAAGKRDSFASHRTIAVRQDKIAKISTLPRKGSPEIMRTPPDCEVSAAKTTRHPDS